MLTFFKYRFMMLALNIYISLNNIFEALKDNLILIALLRCCLPLLQVRSFLKGLFGGTILVLLIYSVNSLIGCVDFCFPMAPPTSSAALTWLKVYGQIFVLFVQGLATATGVATVEELLFRSWLPDEIAADLGYYRGIIISGLAFALFQRCTLI